MIRAQKGMKKSVSIVLGLLLATSVLLSELVSPRTVNALTGFPNYTYLKVVQPTNPSYNPTGEFIFPCVIKATDHLSNPLGTYYLYYAPHDAPGGICLAYSNNIEGPYTEYSGNPIVTNNWQGRYNVTHVSGPYVVWLPQYSKYLMYYHGENTTNRWAYSTDAVHWYYGGICNQASDFGSGFTECQYAKVFECTIQGKSNRYVMVHMLLNGTGSGRRIALSISNDGKTFTPYDNALVSPGPDGCVDIASPSLYRFNGGTYIVYHGSTGKMYITEVGPAFNLENHLGVYHTPLSTTPDNGRSASPFFITDNGVRYLFYEAGQRGSTKIALAKEL